jgi:hypothetical protein
MGYGNDIAVTASHGPPPPRPIRITNALADRLLAASAVDAVVAERFVEVSGFLAPPSALLRPAMLARVLAANVRLARRGHRLLRRRRNRHCHAEPRSQRQRRHRGKSVGDGCRRLTAARHRSTSHLF